MSAWGVPACRRSALAPGGRLWCCGLGQDCACRQACRVHAARQLRERSSVEACPPFSQPPPMHPHTFCSLTRRLEEEKRKLKEKEKPAKGASGAPRISRANLHVRPGGSVLANPGVSLGYRCCRRRRRYPCTRLPACLQACLPSGALPTLPTFSPSPTTSPPYLPHAFFRTSAWCSPTWCTRWASPWTFATRRC